MNNWKSTSEDWVLGMADVVFEDYTIKVRGVIDDRINAVLEECAGELESQIKRNSRVDTGKTKNSFQHKMSGSGDRHEVQIGSSDENAIWEEFGTGEYALQGNGRKGGWVYKDAKGAWYHTYGKRPSRAFWNAFNSTKGKIVRFSPCLAN